MDKKPKYSKKSAYALSGPEPRGWAALAKWHKEDLEKEAKKERERRRGKGPYES